MMDENTNPASTHPFPPEQTREKAEQPTVAYCQQCGKGLTVGAVRAAGSSIFCEPCANRHGVLPENPTAATPGGYTPVHLPDAASTSPSLAGQPNPVLAGLLGLIPGVGAMYNGQYAKGLIHLILFVVLTSLADNLNWTLWWFVWGWIFYQAFDAYHTAQAKRDGMPLPDPFGWNDLGDRLGFGRTSPPAAAGSSPAPAAGAYNAPQTYKAGPVPVPVTAPSVAPVVPESRGTIQTGPPSTEGDALFRQASWPASQPDAATASQAGAPTPPPYVPFAAPYGPTYTGVPVPQAAPPIAPVPPGQRFPAGAIWLIGLGSLFLTANLVPGWRLEARWLVPALLALVAFWIGVRRVETSFQNRTANGTTDYGALAEELIGAAVLLTVAILLALQNAYLVPLRHSWPAVLIVWGALLLAGRARSAVVRSPGDPLEVPKA